MTDLQTNIINEELPEKKMGFIQRVVGVITSPGKVMENLAAKPRVLFPILMMVFAPVIFIFTRLPLFKQLMRESMEIGMRQQNVQLTAEQLEMSINFSSITLAIFLPIILLLCWLAGSAVILGIVKLLKGAGRYKQILSVTGYAMVITLLEFILMYILSFFSGKLMTMFSPALFISDVQGSFFLAFMKSVLSSLDIFSIWGIIIACIGIIAVSRLNKKKVYFVIFGIYVVITILSAFAAGSAAKIM